MLEAEHLGEVVDQSFIGMTSWFKPRNQSKHMYKVHRHIHMKHVVIDIYKQNSSGPGTVNMHFGVVESRIDPCVFIMVTTKCREQNGQI